MGDILNLLPIAQAEVHNDHGGHHGLNFWGLFLYLAVALGVIAYLISNARKGLGNRAFTTKQANWAEQLYLFIENMCVGTIGAHGRKYIPLIMTFWLVIFTGNVMSLFLEGAPTADLGFNLGMALIAIGYVQWEGIKANGFFGHLSHFAGPKLGGPLVLISVMIFIIELFSEVMKNVSLSLRLFANMSGGHTAVLEMNKILGFDLGGHHVFIPVGAFLLPIKVLTCVIQALVFCLLTCVYISLVTHHEHDDHSDVPGEGHHGEVHTMVGA